MTRPKVSLERKLLVALSSAAFAFATSTAWLFLELRAQNSIAGLNTQQLLDQPEVFQRVVQSLVNQAGGDWDSHPDPDVGRVMRPRSNKTRNGITYKSNRMGLREREYELPKPEGVTRVVLLGDSYIYGTKLPADDRVGIFLEEYLRRRAGTDAPEIEVLHLGLISWNFIAECSFLRRQASLLQPDLVIHLTVNNDLDDCYAVRGFGSMARFSTQHPDRAASLVQYRHPTLMMGIGRVNYLNFGLDHESRSRYERAAEEIRRLRHALTAVGSEYFHLLRWDGNPASILPLLNQGVPAEDLACLSQAFSQNKDYWVEENDSHFGGDGMERLAKYLYGEITDRNLLPHLDLPPWAEADQVRETMHTQSAADLAKPKAVPRQFSLDQSFDFQPLTDADACHFNGGIDGEGFLSPYASFTFRVDSPSLLRLRGRGLQRPEIRGVRIEVAVEGIVLGDFQPDPGVDLEKIWELPANLRAREYLNVTLHADDYVYQGEDLRDCVSFQLRGMGFE